MSVAWSMVVDKEIDNRLDQSPSHQLKKVIYRECFKLGDQLGR